jgi:hypothetical protein
MMVKTLLRFIWGKSYATDLFSGRSFAIFFVSGE